MENSGGIFVYISIVEGLLICGMLGWEVFWLSRMYKVLSKMPTADQLGQMVDMIAKDRDAVKEGLEQLGMMFKPLAGMFGGLLGMKKD